LSARAFFGEVERAVAVAVDAMDEHLERVADLEIGDRHTRRKLATRDDAFGLAADVDEQFVVRLRDDQAGEDLTLIECAKALLVEALFECEFIFGLRWFEHVRV